MAENHPLTRPRGTLVFVTYLFPPVETVAAIRTGNIAFRLAELGWHVRVVCPAPVMFKRVSSIEVADARFRAAGIERALTGHHWRFLAGWLKPSSALWEQVALRIMWRLFQRWDPRIDAGWARPVRSFFNTLKPEDVDVILASGPPWIAFKLADRLGRQLQRPVCLDYRDLWNGNPHFETWTSRTATRVESALVRRCAAVTVVAPSMKVAFQTRFPDADGKVHTLTNGYDMNELSAVKPFDFRHRALVYAGMLYPPDRMLTPILSAMRRLMGMAIEHDWRLHLYGPDCETILEEAARLGVAERVVSHGHVSRQTALEAVKGAAASIVITWLHDSGSSAVRGIVPGKVFEAIGLGTPVLGIAPAESDLESIVHNADCGKVFRGSDVESIANYLCGRIRGTQQHTFHGSIYSWNTLARRLDGILSDAVARFRK